MDRETEMYHAAIKILSNRAEQLELADDELAHEGRKGMKWYKNIFGKDEEKNKKQDNGFHPILNFKKEQMLRKARKEEHGGTSEYVPQGPNSVTTQELSDYKTDKQNKKNELLNRAYAERDLRTEKSNSDNRKSQADLYYKTFDDNISQKVDFFIQNDPNVKLYDSLMKDESVNKNDFGDGVGVKIAKNKISGSGSVNENRQKSMSELDSAIREKMYSEIDKEIDQNLSGVYSDTMIQNMKTTAHGKADEMFDSYKQERSNYYTPGLVKNSEGKYVGFNGEEHDSDVSKTARASADKLASQTAFSTGGVVDSTNTARVPDLYKNEVLKKVKKADVEKECAEYINSLSENGRTPMLNEVYGTRAGLKEHYRQILQNAADNYTQSTNLDMVDSQAADKVYELSTAKWEEICKWIDKVCDKYDMPK